MVARRLDALGPGVGRDLSVDIHKGDLANITALVDQEERIECLLSGESALHQIEATRSVGRVDKALGGDGADSGLGPGDDRTHREPVRLDSHAQFAGGRVAGDDRIGVDKWFDGCGRESYRENDEER